MKHSVPKMCCVRMLLAVATVCGATEATYARQPKSVTNDGTLPSSQLDLPRLVDLAAERLGVQVQYDPAVVTGKVTLRLNGALSNQELWDLMNRVLAERQLTTVRVRDGKLFSVVKLADAPGLAPVLPMDGNRAEVGPGFETVVIELLHRQAKEVVESLKQFVKAPGGVTALGDGRLLVVSDVAARVAQAAAVVELLDVPAAEIVVTEYAARSLTPAQLVALATQVVAKRAAIAGEGGKGEGGRGAGLKGEVIASEGGNVALVISPRASVEEWLTLLKQLDSRERVETITYTPRAFGVQEVAGLVEQLVGGGADAGAKESGSRPRIIADELSGALIVTATPAQHGQIRALLERLDGVAGDQRRPMKTFVVRNRPVQDVVDVLQRLIDAGVLEAAANEPVGTAPLMPEQRPADGSAGSAAGGTSAWPPKSGREAGNRSGQSASGASGAATGGVNRSAMTPLSLTADEGTNTIIAVGEPRSLAQLEGLLKSIDIRQPQVMLEALVVSLNESESLQLGVELERIFRTNGDTLIKLASLFGLSSSGSAGRTVGDSTGGSGVVLNPGEFSAIVRALRTISNGRSLSMPRVLALNNQDATLNSTVEQPYASTNASNTVTTTSYGGSSSAGTTLQIKPQIGQGDHLLLKYSISLSAFVGSASDARLPPPRQENRVNSSATIPDGHTVVVGGLTLASDGESVSQVPLLGDIPLLGELFKSRSNTWSNSKFYVFIRAEVLRQSTFEDLKYISERDAAVARVDDGFPEVEPRIMK